MTTPLDNNKNNKISSIFIGTFNTNGSQLSQEDIQQWFHNNQAKNADIVVLSFQECATCCCCHKKDCYDDDFVQMKLHDYCRYDSSMDDEKMKDKSQKQKRDETNDTETEEEEEEEADDKKKARRKEAGNDEQQQHQEKKFLQIIESALSIHHYQVADIAMGEPPCEKIELKDGNLTQWYGFIRLIVYVKGEGTSSKIKKDAIPIICPAGNKLSSYPNQPNYPKGYSPDKGAVCLAIPSLSLLICSAHLAGTNKYNTPEETFDAIRIQQLQQINDLCDKELQASNISLHSLRPIVVGDLNFRCEVHDKEDEKDKGGKDFCAVEKIVSCGDKKKVQSLFLEHDRLCLHLGHTHPPKVDGTVTADHNEKTNKNKFTKQEKEDTTEEDSLSLPLRKIDLLKDVVDLFWRESLFSINKEKEKCAAAEGVSKIILPTFTFKVGDTPPRSYAKKRTPSWTDRILVSQRLLSSPSTGTSFTSGCEEREKKYNDNSKKKNNSDYASVVNHYDDSEGTCLVIRSSGEVTSLGTSDDIVLSDHVPIYCLIEFK